MKEGKEIFGKTKVCHGGNGKNRRVFSFGWHHD